MIRRNSIADEVYDFRVRHRMTQDAFADLTGLSRATVNYIECGRREPARYTVARLRLFMRNYDEENKE